MYVVCNACIEAIDTPALSLKLQAFPGGFPPSASAGDILFDSLLFFVVWISTLSQLVFYYQFSNHCSVIYFIGNSGLSSVLTRVFMIYLYLFVHQALVCCSPWPLATCIVYEVVVLLLFFLGVLPFHFLSPVSQQQQQQLQVQQQQQQIIQQHLLQQANTLRAASMQADAC